MSRKKKKWIPKLKTGSLHKQLHLKKDEKIPKSILLRIKNSKIGDTFKFRGYNIRVTRKLKKRGVLAYTMSKFRKHRRR